MLAASGIITARRGARVSSALSPPKLALAMGVFRVIMAPMVPLKAFIRDWAAEQRQQAAEKPKAASAAVGDGIEEAAPLRRIRLLGIGATTGFASGLFGVGGGTIMVPALALGTEFVRVEAGQCIVPGPLVPHRSRTSTETAYDCLYFFPDGPQRSRQSFTEGCIPSAVAAAHTHLRGAAECRTPDTVAVYSLTQPHRLPWAGGTKFTTAPCRAQP